LLSSSTALVVGSGGRRDRHAAAFVRSAILRAVLKGLLRDHLRVDERVLTADIFPGSDNVAPMTGLLA
jgi:hypothetical protein